LLILRFSPRGLIRLRLETTRSSRISSTIASWKTFLCRGGNSAVARHPALDNMHRVDEGQPVRNLIGLQGGFVHEAADSKMRHQQTEELLLDQFRRLATQNNLSAAQMGF
jgi:hypothetical protein